MVMRFRVVIPLTENKKCTKYAKYDSSRPIVLDSYFSVCWQWKYIRVRLSVEYNNKSATWYACTSSYFVSGITIQCIQTSTTFIAKSGFSFVHHLRVITLWVFNRSLLFWFYSKRNWVLYNVVCITQFQPFGTFHLGLTYIF